MIHFDVNYLIHPVSAEVPTKHLADIEDKIPENYSQFQSLDSKKSPSVQQRSNRVDRAQEGAVWESLEFLLYGLGHHSLLPGLGSRWAPARVMPQSRRPSATEARPPPRALDSPGSLPATWDAPA